MKKVLFAIVLVVSAALFAMTACAKQTKPEPETVPIDGGKTEEWMEGYKDEIVSKDIISFEYSIEGYSVSCVKEGDKLHILASGGNSYERDGSYFKLDYECEDLSFLETLQKLVEENNISKDNGYIREVAGLPSGLGDTISVKYASGEAIYKSSNQFPSLAPETSEKIYEAFHQHAVENGYDFNSEGSNVLLYNDADENYLQGTWTGKHFGSEYKAVFEGKRVKIYCNDKLTDDCEYAIYEGCIRKNQLAEGKTEAKSEYDYEEFSEISCFRKSNDFTIVAYYMKDSYSTDRLIKQD